MEETRKRRIQGRKENEGRGRKEGRKEGEDGELVVLTTAC